MSDRRYQILIEVEAFSDIGKLDNKVRKPGIQIFVKSTKRFYYWNTEEQSFLPTQSSSGGGSGVYITDADNNVFYSGVEATTTLTGVCTNNTFHQGAENNNLLNDNIGNTFNQLAAGNTLGDSSHYNVFDIKASDNYLDQSCLYNTFKQGASNNILDANSQYNTFEQGANTNFLDDNCNSNTFGEGSSRFIFGMGLQNVTIEPNLVGSNYGNPIDYAFLYGNSYAATIFTDGTNNYHRYYDVANDRIVITLMASPFTVTYIGGSGGSGLTKYSGQSGTVIATATSGIHAYFFTDAGSLVLPTAVGNNAIFKVKNAHTSNITVTFTGGEQADNSATITLIPWQALEFISNNVKYNIF